MKCSWESGNTSSNLLPILLCPLAEESPERRVAQSVVPVIHSPEIPHCFLCGTHPSYQYHETNAKWSSFLFALKLGLDGLVFWVDFFEGSGGGNWFALIFFFVFVCILTCSKSHFNLSRFLIWIRKELHPLFPSLLIFLFLLLLIPIVVSCWHQLQLAWCTVYSQEFQTVTQVERKVLASCSVMLLPPNHCMKIVLHSTIQNIIHLIFLLLPI